MQQLNKRLGTVSYVTSCMNSNPGFDFYFVLVEIPVTKFTTNIWEPVTYIENIILGILMADA